MASAGAGRARRGEEQVWYKPLSLPWVLSQRRAGAGEVCGFLWAAGEFPWERLLSGSGGWGWGGSMEAAGELWPSLPVDRERQRGADHATGEISQGADRGC